MQLDRWLMIFDLWWWWSWSLWCCWWWWWWWWWWWRWWWVMIGGDGGDAGGGDHSVSVRQKDQIWKLDAEKVVKPAIARGFEKFMPARWMRHFVPWHVRPRGWSWDWLFIKDWKHRGILRLVQPFSRFNCILKELVWPNSQTFQLQPEGFLHSMLLQVIASQPSSWAPVTVHPTVGVDKNQEQHGAIANWTSSPETRLFLLPPFVVDFPHSKLVSHGVAKPLKSLSCLAVCHGVFEAFFIVFQVSTALALPKFDLIFCEVFDAGLLGECGASKKPKTTKSWIDCDQRHALPTILHARKDCMHQRSPVAPRLNKSNSIFG